ncbi:MAG TPA: arginine N-succinyltransferase, partial [Chlamydiales bacterium]|nr:arginine N-succinyltransferase [Chlamydiales bacterium]
MIVLRPIRETDLPDLIQLRKNATHGYTTFPSDKSKLEENIHRAVASFRKKASAPHDEFYLFALEDQEAKKVIGISAIMATTGGETGSSDGGGHSLYFFKREKEIVQAAMPQITEELEILSPVSYLHGPSELCSLFLQPHERHHGLGKLLSFGRFLYIARHPERFTETIFAELRGVINNGISPFWDGVGRHFFNATFQETIDLRQYGTQFIGQFLPKYPIYVATLPQEVQEVIGKTHPHTQAALILLMEQGFQITDEIDIFDGGPKLKAMKKEINVVHKSRTATICQIVDTITTPTDCDKHFLVSNDGDSDFCACSGACTVVGDTIIISKTT